VGAMGAPTYFFLLLMTAQELLKTLELNFGEDAPDIARYMAGMLVRKSDDMTNCIDILQELDDYSYE
jgi:hypothetical protein